MEEMRKIDVVIPTRKRIGKLHKAIDSIPHNVGEVEVNVIVISDGDVETVQEVMLIMERVDQILFVRGHHGAVYCRNLVTPSCEDMVLYATDDITFRAGAIASALKSLDTLFPDGDGVIGFLQENAPNRNFNPAGVGLMGQKFLKRYPGKKIFYPKYFHFACQEILWLSDKHEKFVLDEGARLYHFHPAFYPKLKDQCHADARIFRKKDHDLIKKRKREGKIWGDHA